MTVICGVEDGERVWLGGDSCISWRDTMCSTGAPKVWVCGPYVIGWAGDVAAGSALRAALSLPKKIGLDLDAFAQSDLCRAFRTALSHAGFEKKNELSILIGCKGRLWSIESLRGAFRAGETYTAIGSGTSWALGSLASTTGTPRARIQKALRATAKHHAFVRPPYHVVSV